MKVLKNYPHSDVGIEIHEVLRYLAYRKDEKAPPLWIKEVIEDQITTFRPLIKPWGIYSIFDNTSFKEHEILGDAGQLAFGICSIGQELEEAAESLFRKREYLEWLVLDAIGTVATEKLAELIRDEIKEKVSGTDVSISRRLSPGYGNWQLDGQHLIFQHFSSEPLKVRKNESCMMTPRKSLSFAFKLGRWKIEGTEQENCQHCNLFARCAFKKDHLGNACNK